MTPQVEACLKAQIELRDRYKTSESNTGNYKNFLFLNLKTGRPLSGDQITGIFVKQVEVYNKHHPDAPIHFHPHDLRSLFATTAAQHFGVDIITRRYISYTEA